MKLNVYGEMDGCNHLVGALETVPGKEEQFSYDRSFIERWPQSELSISLPLQTQSYPARKTRTFFRNLLPEAQALTAVARELEVRSSSYLKILQVLGRECVGAITICSEADDPTGAFGYDPISREELAMHAKSEALGMAQLQIQSRLSLAGAQSKIGLYATIENGRFSYSIPKGSAPSTYIVKASNHRFESLTENEFCCLRVAQACGLDVPAVHIDTIDENESLLVVKRFDRVVENDCLPGTSYKRVRRLHQEDLCQALGKLPEQKYEAPGQGYVKLVSDTLFKRSLDPADSAIAFAKLLVLNTVLGNCDAHLKNISLLKGDRWDHNYLAPAYDIASTVIYDKLDRTMAMRIGAASRIDDVSREDFLSSAKDLRVAKRIMESVIDDVAQGVHDNLAGIIEEAEDTVHAHVEKLHDLARFTDQQVCKLTTR